MKTTDVVIEEKSVVQKSLWLSLEISYQEVFCANNTVGNSVVELT